ncbi:hypothetical protein P43SY_000750 [Pythium insidiosum]|uniref:Peptidase n=1 Tax=Pythium insidiosum TaxID=114742 RepID=A0AAD5LTC7_PYTIN|nr:hypothetical protein P43SY_000750 [Pythium insidiosum]
MQRTGLLVMLLLAGAAVCSRAEDRCTAILVGAKASANGAPMTTHSADCASCDFRIAKASANGAPMTTHSADCASCDFRIAKVPAQRHDDGEQHDVVLIKLGYPRYGDVYKPENLDTRFYQWNETAPIGSIPEVSETYGYIDGVYGILNEHQLAMGESTCSARFVSRPKQHGGEALFDIAALSRVAMQRTKTARDAILLMGDLAVQYGYYGAEWEGDGAFGEAGEALTIADPQEAWVFHILPDDTGRSAIWAAQRVPDDHVSVVANEFVIHDVRPSDSANFLASANLFDVAIRHSLWHPDSGIAFDFARIYSAPVTAPSSGLAYSNRRVWRVLTLTNPEEGAALSPTAEEYPFSIRASRRLSPLDIMAFHRDHYEGTPFDMTQGAAAGPFGDPDRYDPSPNGDLTADDLSRGHFERAISIFRASYSFVSVLDPANADNAYLCYSFVSVLDPANADNAYLWFGQYAPHASVYAPVFAKVDRVPTEYSASSLFAFDKQSSFWVNALVGNWAARFYRFAHPYVSAAQRQLETGAEQLVADIREQAAEMKRRDGDSAMRQFLTEQSELFARESVASMWQLFEYLVTVFHDGYEMTGFDKGELHAKKLFYPKWWLELVGFFGEGHEPSGEGRPGASISSGAASSEVHGVSYTVTLLSCLLTGGIGVAAGVVLSRKRAKTEYHRIQ